MATALIADRVKETTAVVGTGNATLTGAAPGFRTFASAFANNSIVPYVILDPATADWEAGLGTYSVGVLSRSYRTASSNAGAAVAFAAGPKDVFVAPIASIGGTARNTAEQAAVPTWANNLSQGYGPGSLWVTTSNRVFLCVWSDPGSAGWVGLANMSSSIGKGSGDFPNMGADSVVFATPYATGTGVRNATIASSDNNCTNNGQSTVLMAQDGGNVGATAKYSVVHGRAPVATEHAFARVHGFSRANGVAQKNEVGLAVTTVDATPTALTLENGVAAARYLVSVGSNATHTFRALASVTGASRHKGWEIKGVIRSYGGTVALVGVPTVTSLGEEGTGMAAATIAVTADNTNKALIFTATGVAGVMLRWLVAMDVAVVVE